MSFPWKWDAFAALGIYPRASFITYRQDVSQDGACRVRRNDSRQCPNRPSRHKQDVAAYWLLKLCSLDRNSDEAYELLPLIAQNIVCPLHNPPQYINILVERWSGILANETAAIWNAVKLFDIDRRESGRCVGWAPSKGRDCRMFLAASNWERGINRLKQISQAVPDPSLARRQLSPIARLMLCKQYHGRAGTHHDQTELTINKWARKMRTWRSVTNHDPVLLASIELAALNSSVPTLSTSHVSTQAQATPHTAISSDSTDIHLRPLTPTSTHVTGISSDSSNVHLRPLTPTSTQVTVSGFSGLLTPPPSDFRAHTGETVRELDLPLPPYTIPRQPILEASDPAERGSPQRPLRTVDLPILMTVDDTSVITSNLHDTIGTQRLVDNDSSFEPETPAEQGSAGTVSDGERALEEAGFADERTVLSQTLTALETFDDPTFSFAASADSDVRHSHPSAASDGASVAEIPSVASAANTPGHDLPSPVHENALQSRPSSDSCGSCGYAEILLSPPVAPPTDQSEPISTLLQVDTSFIAQALAYFSLDQYNTGSWDTSPYPTDSCVHTGSTEQTVPSPTNTNSNISSIFRKAIRTISTRALSCLPCLTERTLD